MVFPGSPGSSRSPGSGASGSPAGGFRPSHVVPAEGLPAWEEPDPSRPTVPLDPFLPVQLLDRVGDWGQVLCSNGWSAWVDGRLLVSVPPDPPAADRPMGTASDPRPLLTRAEEAVGRYRAAAEELVAGRVDGETFRRRTQGLRIGLVVDGEALWMYDARRERWLYCDGTRLSTYAASAGPSAVPSAPEPVPPAAGAGTGRSGGTGADEGPPAAAAPAGYEPTRVVDHAPVPDAAPEPTRVVEPEQPAAAPEPTRVVDPQPPEPTRVVEPQPPDPAAEPTRIVEPQQSEPTRVVEPDEHSPVPDAAAEPTRVVEPEDRDGGEGGWRGRGGAGRTGEP
ncbi:hypothetical protein [Streptomyces sp. WAC05374]|uniref:hypothetical protein n=1 Tax=Streptomyces sp. WAC05374 TaxID=2487420 RepID=UPI001F3320AD|nr:hypothetical protein [Streptomyces sp. WAC05374]